MANESLIPSRDRKVDLSDYDPGFTGDYSRSAAKRALGEWQLRFKSLQEKLYAQGERSLLIILQAMDSGGKDSTIKSVFTTVNPFGLTITSFKEPTELELAHDFLWRVHQAVPRNGMIGIFNRSHYEDVLVVRVNKLVPEETWKKRYDHINNFEQLLVDSGTVILKFFLNISKEEQKERFTERLTNPEKHWKFSHGDLAVREQWDDYMRAYEDVFEKTNTRTAPWHIIPANVKWYRNLIVTQTVVETMETMGLEFPPAEPDLDKVVIPD